VLTALIKNLHADPFFNVFPTAREEEAVGIVSGAWMGGMRGAMLMQTSGYGSRCKPVPKEVALTKSGGYVVSAEYFYPTRVILIA
jgi:sulfopyruvate decarboxylase TPP-binding subunit